MKHYQVQWVQKDQQDSTPNKKAKAPEFEEDDDEILQQYIPEEGFINQSNYIQVRRTNHGKRKNHQNWRNIKSTTEAVQINDLEKRIYNSKTIMLLFKQQPAPFNQIASCLLTEFPMIFLKKPYNPTKYSNNHDSENEEPEWLKEDDQAFEFRDIETQLEEKRIKYQKEHGTLEKKQEERLLKEIEKKKQEELNRQLEEEKEKFRQQKKNKLEKQNSTSNNEIQNQLEQLFQMVGTQNSEDIQLDLENLSFKQKSVSEIEAEILKNSPPKKITQQQQKDSSQQQFQYYQEFSGQLSQSSQQSLEFDLYSLLNLNNSNTSKVDDVKQQIDIPPNQRIIPLEKINKEPFSTQAVLNNKKPNELNWFYIDKNQKIQGGFSSVNMDQWYKQGYLLPDLQLSWEKPCVWISLDQFISNLDLISRGELGTNKAMQAKSKPEVKEKLKDQNQKDKILQPSNDYCSNPKVWNAVSAQMMPQMNPYQYGQNTINVLNNVIQINTLPQSSSPTPTQQPLVQQQPQLQDYQQYQQQFQLQQQQQLIQYYQRQLQGLQAQQQKLLASISSQGMTVQQKQQWQNIQQQQQQISLQMQYQLQMQQYLQQQQQIQIQQQYNQQAKKQNEIPIFQIGLKKEMIQTQTVPPPQTEYVPDSKEFPSLGETEFTRK